ncbi:hypothetical protein V6N13_004293 [Hibiscus sabdariffa]|uniref:RING-type E3 ubiquitin transferase n=2 Tax=Hibiscus sabdariffa TaxID=183260 RepID=A0ABR1ZKC1_9ROSI
MAVVTISFVVGEHGFMREEAHPVPADDVRVLLYIVTDVRDQLHRVLDPRFARVGIDTSSITYYDIVQEIVECVLEASWMGVDVGETLCLSCIIRAELTESDINGDNSLTRALAESASEFERDSYGMVAATEASIEEMLERVEVEAGDETCVICLNQLEVGFEASRMPCSHGFHGGCIEKWLRQNHYCPICRFEMPVI